MKFTIIVSFFISLFLQAGSPEEYSLASIENPPLVTLKAAFEMAKKHNFSLKKKHNDVLIAEGTALQSFSSLLPNLGVKAEYQKSILDNSDNDEKKAAIFVNIPLLDVKSIFSSRSAQANLASVKLSFQHEQNELLYNVATAYLEALMAQSMLGIGEEEREQYKKQLEVLEKKLHVGTVRPLDVSRGEYLLKKSESELVAKEREFAKKLAHLGLLLDHRQNFLLEDFDIDSAYFNESSAALAEFAQQSADILALKKDHAAQNFALVSQYDFFPKLNTRIEGGWRSLDLASDNQSTNPFAQIFFTIELPLFSGGSRIAAIKKARAARSSTYISLQELRLKKELNVMGTLEQITAYRLALESAEQALHAAQKAKESSDRLFNAGEATTLEVAQANVELVSAKSSAANAKLKFNQSKINLLFLINRLGELS